MSLGIDNGSNLVTGQPNRSYKKHLSISINHVRYGPNSIQTKVLHLVQDQIFS